MKFQGKFTVQQLIDKLQELPNKDATIVLQGEDVEGTEDEGDFIYNTLTLNEQNGNILLALWYE